MKNQARTDLAMESLPIGGGDGQGFTSTEKVLDDGSIVHNVSITSEELALEINKKVGDYSTLMIESGEFRELDLQKYTAIILSETLNSIIEKTTTLDKNSTILVVGLGNANMASDSLGSKVVGKIVVTRHVYDVVSSKFDTRLSKVCAICPNVLGITGVESFDIVKGLVDRIKPSLVVVVDSLASLSTNRIARTFQITNTGITPGGGVGNRRVEMSQKTLGCHVIAIGVPLVVYATTLLKDGGADPSIGIEGVSPNLIVTPKDIDIIVSDCSFIVAGAINLSLHKNLTIDDALSYTH